MKQVFFSALVSLAANIAFAGVADVQPSADRIAPSTVESVRVVQKETAKQPSIRLVQVDNGGSTDISSSQYPSRLYVTIHQDGEMRNVQGNYLISQGLVGVKSFVYHPNTQILAVVLSTKNDLLETSTEEYSIHLNEALYEVANPQGAQDDSDDFTDYNLKSTVGLQNNNL